ncbi:hypothetical protein GDO78_020157 [Eleutherodactylus coqui]|uniref:Uncharacterized protein n=1 Tax=Eleutherodactylus coqui TaxID=57060 RepID=A0A8J6ECE4_ELECQ|nr:hypothetical protein GDO78_020157 [Eleutherodactylus coqui]
MESAAALLLLLGVFGCCRGLEPIAVCSGSDVTFRAAASARPLEINWFKDSSKIVEVEEGKDPFYFTCQGRCIVNLPRRTLIVTNQDHVVRLCSPSYFLRVSSAPKESSPF